MSKKSYTYFKEKRRSTFFELYHFMKQKSFLKKCNKKVGYLP